MRYRIHHHNDQINEKYSSSSRLTVYVSISIVIDSRFPVHFQLIDPHVVLEVRMSVVHSDDGKSSTQQKSLDKKTEEAYAFQNPFDGVARKYTYVPCVNDAHDSFFEVTRLVSVIHKGPSFACFCCRHGIQRVHILVVGDFFLDGYCVVRLDERNVRFGFDGECDLLQWEPIPDLKEKKKERIPLHDVGYIKSNIGP